jgi:hypothetical protein
MINLTENLTGIVRSISGKIRADEDVPKSESVTVHLDIDFSDCTIEDVLQFACADRKIAWANGSGGRKAIGKLTNGQHIKVRAASPGVKPPEDPMDILIARADAAGRTLEEQIAWEKAQRGMK